MRNKSRQISSLERLLKKSTNTIEDLIIKKTNLETLKNIAEDKLINLEKKIISEKKLSTTMHNFDFQTLFSKYNQEKEALELEISMKLEEINKHITWLKEEYIEKKKLEKLIKQASSEHKKEMLNLEEKTLNELHAQNFRRSR